MSPITSSISSTSSTGTSTASASFHPRPQNDLSPRSRQEISNFLTQEVNDQHTGPEISKMLVRAFNTGEYRHTGKVELSLWHFDFSIPAGETCVVPPEVELNGCRLMSAGTMEISRGSLYAARQGATAIAAGPGAVVRACGLWTCAIARVPGSEASSESSGVAYAAGPGTSATAHFGGTAYADSDNSVVYAKGFNSQAHARVAGARSFACEIDSTATARNGARAVANKSGAVAIAVNDDSVATATVPGAAAYAESYGANAIGVDGGRAIALGDGAIEVNKGEPLVLRSAPASSFGSRKSDGRMTVMEGLLAKKAAAELRSSRVNFQGRFGNESITSEDLGLDDDETTSVSKVEVRKTDGKTVLGTRSSAEPDQQQSRVGFQGNFGNEAITAEDLGLIDD